MSGKTITPSINPDTNKKKYLTLIFSYNDCTKNSYDTINNFIAHIISETDKYNQNKPYVGSTRYNIERFFTSGDIDIQDQDNDIDKASL